MIGFDGRHTRAHIYRSILEGVALTMKKYIFDMIEEVDVDIKKVIVTGGGSSSDLFMQIIADVLGIPTVRNVVNGAAGLGAAICAAVAAGVYPDFATAVTKMVRISDKFNPIPANSEIYDKMYPIYWDITNHTDAVLKKSYEIFE